jgi:hypothetical protein
VALLARYRQRLLELSGDLAVEAAASEMRLDHATLGRYLLMANGYISPTTGVPASPRAEAAAAAAANDESAASAEAGSAKGRRPSGLLRGLSQSTSRKAAPSSPPEGSGGSRCAAASLVETVRWRRAHGIGQLPKALLLQAATAKQLYVGGYDRGGRAVVLYTPTTEATRALSAPLTRTRSLLSPRGPHSCLCVGGVPRGAVGALDGLQP